MAVPPEVHVLHGVNAGYKSQDLLQQPRREHASLGMPGQSNAFAATHGIYVLNCLRIFENYIQNYSYWPGIQLYKYIIFYFVNVSKTNTVQIT